MPDSATEDSVSPSPSFLFEFDVRLTVSDIRLAILAWILRRPLTWIMECVAAFFLLVFFIDVVATPSRPIPMLVIGLVWAVLPFLPLMRTSSYLGVDELRPSHYRFDEQGLKRTTDVSSLELGWASVLGYRETSAALLLVITKRCFFMIPKRAFPDTESVARVSSFLDQTTRRR